MEATSDKLTTGNLTVKEFPGRIKGSIGKIGIYGMNGRQELFMAEPMSSGSVPELREYARLFASAPDMLDMLKAIIADCRKWLDGDSDVSAEDLIEAIHRESQDCADLAQGKIAAIAKATGNEQSPVSAATPDIPALRPSSKPDQKQFPIYFTSRNPVSPSLDPIFVREEMPGYMLGSVSILGTDHHLELIEVLSGNEGFAQVPRVEDEDGNSLENDNDSRYDAMQQNDAGIYQTVELDGRQWVCHVTPYCD